MDAIKTFSNTNVNILQSVINSYKRSKNIIIEIGYGSNYK